MVEASSRKMMKPRITCCARRYRRCVGVQADCSLLLFVTASFVMVYLHHHFPGIDAAPDNSPTPSTAIDQETTPTPRAASRWKDEQATSEDNQKHPNAIPTSTVPGILDAAEDEVYYRKCCRINEYYHTDVENMVARCQRRFNASAAFRMTNEQAEASLGGIDFPWKPWTVFDEYLLPVQEYNRHLLRMNASVGFPVCSSRKQDYMALMDPTDVFQLLDTGSLYIPAFRKTYKPPMYCLDETLIHYGDAEGSSGVSTPKQQPVVLLCVEDGRKFAPRVARDGIMYPIISACLLISAASLIVTIFVYFVTPEGWNLHGETLQCHVGSLGLGYVFLFSARVVTKEQLKLGAVCKAIGILAHFFLLSAFFWLHIMCFDVFWTIRRFRSRESMGNPRQWKRFFKYCTYAWGAPLLISGAALGMDLFSVNSKLNPRFSDSSLHCWFAGSDWAIFAYFYGPVAVLLMSNTVMFGFTIRHLIRHEKDTAALRENRRSAAQTKKRLVLYIELFVIMGLTWVAEVISWKLGSPEIWYVFDLLNALQGVFVFFIFVCKPKIMRHLRDYFLRKRWCCSCCKRLLLRAGNVTSGADGQGDYRGGGAASRANSTGTSATVQTICSRLSSTDSMINQSNGSSRKYLKRSINTATYKGRHASRKLSTQEWSTGEFDGAQRSRVDSLSTLPSGQQQQWHRESSAFIPLGRLNQDEVNADSWTSYSVEKGRCRQHRKTDEKPCLFNEGPSANEMLVPSPAQKLHISQAASLDNQRIQSSLERSLEGTPEVSNANGDEIQQSPIVDDDEGAEKIATPSPQSHCFSVERPSQVDSSIQLHVVPSADSDEIETTEVLIVQSQLDDE